MSQCLDGQTDPNFPPTNCGEFQEEIGYARAYRSFIFNVEGPSPASTALVVFHNLVTASVSHVNYLQGSIRQYYCVKDVLLGEPQLFGADFPAPAAGPPAPVPGLGPQHPLLACPA